MYVATHSHTLAVDPVTGRQLWRAPVDLPADINGFLCCGIQSRGLAALDGVLYRTTLDAHVVALSMKDGKQLWKQKAADYKQGYSMTHAPLIAGGVLITGISGGEYGTRGFLNAWDLKTGEKKWHRWTTATGSDKGADTWKPGMAETGGGPTWLTGTYDPDLDLVYWGTGNGAPWNAAMRGGDSLYIGSVLAIRPATGEIVWHYQYSPGDPFDYDGVNEPVLADIPGLGSGKVLMQANRNGFFYVLDRTNGKLLLAKAFVKQTWNAGFDENGRPKIVPGSDSTPQGSDVYPSLGGGTNWQSPSYDASTGLLYLSYLEMGNKYIRQTSEFESGKQYWGGRGGPLQETPTAGIRAIDTDTGAIKWDYPISQGSLSSGVLATAGKVLFAATPEGNLIALDSATGKFLWKFQAGGPIASSPMSYSVGGKQYVAVSSAGVLYSFALPQE
jgi:alcohol dehydrogenase (cytochrome c)